MGKIFSSSNIASLIALAITLTACSDNIPLEESLELGVDRNNIVEVDVPFSVGNGISSHIVTRSTKDIDQQGTDSQLSGIMVFVYENTGDASKDKRLAFHLFDAPGTSHDESTGGWIPDVDDNTKGHIKLYLPTGNLFIYLIGNAMGSFLDFFPDRNESSLETRQDFLDLATPKWSGNVYTVDGYLPLIGKVNNSTAACKVEEVEKGTGVLSYINDNGDKHFITQTEETEINVDNSFVLERLMCKVSMEFISGKDKNGENVKFTPKTYRFRNCTSYVPISPESWEVYKFLPTVETNTMHFDAQTPNSFTVYLPENIREYTGEGNLTFHDRDKVKKDIDGNNITETTVDGIVHYDFQYAPKKSTYVEITGNFEGSGVSADTKYILHLGDFSGNKFNEFSLKRDYHYTYTVTVNGVDDIIVEVRGNESHNTPVETNPAVEGIVFEGGARMQLDAHFEQVEMKLSRDRLENGVYIYAQTPYGDVNCKYLPSAKSLDPQHGNTPDNIEDIKKLLEWVEFKNQQNGKGYLAKYFGDNDRMDVFAALDHAYANTSPNLEYYTCFIDEYYYTTNPVTGTSAKLKDFVNTEDRTFSLGSHIQYSNDKQSAVATAVYVLQQHPIVTFYNLENETVAKFGVETIDEIGTLAENPLPYGNPSSESSDTKNGRSNTSAETRNQSNSVNWERNGFLLNNDDTELVPSANRLNTGSAYLACLTRNRDFNGDGNITDDELRWYTPARDQLLGLWIGEPALPSNAALYPYTTTNLSHLGTKSNHPIYSSTNGQSRVIWSEEGCSFGDVASAGNQGYVRAVRNLGSKPSQDSHTTDPQPYYSYDSTNRIITVDLTSNALRAFSTRELAPHHERSVVNRPYRSFQIASRPYVLNATASCSGHGLVGSTTRQYVQLQTTSASDAKNNTTTIAANYTGNGEPDKSTAAWRLPNQREMALMIVAMGSLLDYDMDNSDYHHPFYGCSGGFITHSWSYDDNSTNYKEENYILHCRTSFSNKSYAPIGYMYNTGWKILQMIWSVDDGEDFGQGRTGIGGYLCVRDVQ